MKNFQLNIIKIIKILITYDRPRFFGLTERNDTGIVIG